MSSAALIALGVTVLVGWALDLVSLKSLHPALASMKANTAWLFVALGCALRSSGREERAADHVRRALTVVVIAVSVATLGEDLVGIDLGIDELPFSDPITRAQGDPPGRMSIATALSFLLLGVAVHRVKNNLQVISSLINLQARQLGDARARGALEECRSRVEAIALIHEKLYQAKDYARVAF